MIVALLNSPRNDIPVVAESAWLQVEPCADHDYVDEEQCNVEQEEETSDAVQRIESHRVRDIVHNSLAYHFRRRAG